ncbi:flagellar protein FlgN, partial [Marinobacter sp. 71-i]
HNELKVINERNQLLIQQSLELIRYELDLIAGPSEQEITYAPTSAGQGYVGGASRRSFDTRA